MDVKFTLTSSNKLANLDIVNGQLIYLADIDAAYYDVGGSRRPVSSMKIVNQLPQPSQAQENMLYVIIGQNGQATASLYSATTSSFVSLAGAIATTTTVGLVKPDGTTITIDNNGTISCHVSSVAASSVTYDNTTSGLSSTAAQGAIDELTLRISQLEAIAEKVLLVEDDNVE